MRSEHEALYSWCAGGRGREREEEGERGKERERVGGRGVRKECRERETECEGRQTSIVKIIKNEVGCRDDTVPKTVETRRHYEED